MLLPLILFIVCVIGCYFLYSYFRGDSRNMFTEPIKPDPKDMKHLTDDEIIKTSYSKKTCEKFVNNKKHRFDTVIIGSGISGMTCASLLAQEGKSVLVLEQNEQLGGYCHSFEEEGYTFETGIHYLPKLHNGSFATVIFDKISEKKIEFFEFHENNEPYDTLKMLPSKKEYSVFTTEKMKLYLKKEFPQEGKKIEEYFKLVSDTIKAGSEVLFVTRELPSWLRTFAYPFLPQSAQWLKLNHKSVKEVINTYFKNEDLKRIFTYMTYLAGSYKSTPFVVLPFVFGAYNIKGVCYPKVPGMFPRYIGRTVRKHGGQCLVNAKVERILTKGNKAIGVKMVNGDEIYAKHVVSTAGIMNTYSFLEEKFHPKELEKAQCSSQCFYVFLGFKENYKKLGFPKTNYIVCGDFDKEGDLSKVIMKNKDIKKVKFEPVMFFCSFHNHLMHEKEKKSQCIVMFPADYGVFEKWKDTKIKQRGNEYEEVKGYFVDETLKLFFEAFPKAKGALEYCVGGSPLTSKHYTNWPKGEMYGMKVTPDRLFNQYDSLIKGCKVVNLQISGTDSFIHCGVIPACITGLISAGKILKRDLVREVYKASSIRRKEFKKMKKKKEEEMKKKK